MPQTTVNFDIPLPEATETSKRLADIRYVRSAFIAVDGSLAIVNSNIASRVSTQSLGVAGGVATLDNNGKVPESQLPVYIDAALEFSSLGGFPTIGESGKIYVAIDTSKTYRWSGSVYTEITSGAVSTVNGKNGAVLLDRADIGLNNVDNTSDIDKPVSIAQQTAIDIAQTATIAASASIAHVGSGGGAHSVATNGANGFMSSTDKIKLDAISGTNTGDQTTITGNAGSATRLQTPRTINGVSFDGTADIVISGAATTLTSKQIGFGNASNQLIGSTKFTWDNVTNTLSLSDGSTSATLVIPVGTVRSTLNIIGQDSPGGSSTLHAGNVNIRGGYGNSATNAANGGDVNISGGFVQSFLGRGTGGSVNITAGGLNNWGDGVGGNVNISAGGTAKDNAAGGSVIVSTGGNSKTGTGLTRGGSFQVWTYSGAEGVAKTTYSRQFMIRETGAWVLGPVGDDYSATGPGAVGQVLMSNGANSAPQWGNYTVGTLPTLEVTGSAQIGNLTVSGDSIASAGSTITIDPSGAGPAGLVVIAGDLQVTGTTVTLDATTVTTSELNVTIAKDAANAAAADGAGITVAGADATFTYAATTDRWNLNKGLSINGSLTVAGTGSRIVADLSSALNARTFVQSSVLNGLSSLGVIPNGTSTTAIVGAHNSSDPINSSSVYLQSSSTDSRIVSDKAGTGTYLPLTVHVGGFEWLRIGIAGGIGLGGANYGSAGQVIASNGPGAAATWQSPSAAAGSLTGTTLAPGVTASSLTSVGTLTSLTVSGVITTNGNTVGYLEVPQNAQGSYTLGLTDSGKHILTNTGGVTWTIPANVSVAFKIGTTVTFVNTGAAASTIVITNDTMIQNKVGPKTSLTLSGYGMATAIKVGATTWMIAGDLA